MPSKWAEFAHQARAAVEQDCAAFQDCRCPGNLELVLFLGHCKDLLAREQNETLLGAMRKTYKSVKTHPSRIYSLAHLKALPGTGSSVSGIVKDNLWSVYPPEPPSQEELEIENRQQQQAAQEKQRVKDLNKKRKAEDKAAAAVAAARERCSGGAEPDPLGGGLLDENGIPPGEQDDELGSQAGRKRKKTIRAKKEYVPDLKSANWVFLLMLLKHLRGSKTFMTKSELMDEAEASGLSAKPIKGGGVTSFHGGPPNTFVYDGWSNFPRLCNREPPLCLQYSNPKKIKLTPDGEKLAARIYHKAVADNHITWRIPGVLPPSGHEGAPQPAPSPALPRAAPARPPSQAFRNQSHASHVVYGQHSSTPHGGIHAGRALEPQGPRYSPNPMSLSGGARVSARPYPSTARVGSLQSGLLSHPSSSLRADEEEPSLAQRLSQPQSQPYSDSQPMSQSGSQGLQAKEAGGSQLWSQSGSQVGSHWGSEKHPLVEQQQPAMCTLEKHIMQVVEITDCSYRTAKKMLKGVLGVEDAVETYFELPSEYNSDEEDHDDGDDISHLGSQHMVDDYTIPMGASQSTNPVPMPNHMDTSHLGRRPAKKGSAMTVPVPSLLTHPASLRTEPSSQSAAQSHSQQLSVSRQQSGSGSLGSTLGRERSLAGAAAPSRLGAAGQGRAAAPSQQASQGVGHIAAAQLESSGTSWKLPFLGAGGSLEETDIRLPPLSPGACFSDEYKLVLIVDSREQYSNAGRNRVDQLASHVQTIRDRGIPVDIRTLQQGDVLWIAQSRRQPGLEYVLDYVLERKRVDDMINSIKSRRYDRQKFNMNMCGLRHLIYLVEGNPDTLGNESDTKAVKSGTIQTQVIDGFQILRSEHCNQTMIHLAEWTKALKRKYDGLTAHDPKVQRGGDPLPTLEVFKAKSAQMQKCTVQDVWGLMLTSIPGWSGAMAEAVVKQYGTPKLLFKAYERAIKAAAQQGRNPVEAARHLLMSCQLSKNRRPISANNSARVFDSLFANGWQCV